MRSTPVEDRNHEDEINSMLEEDCAMWLRPAARDHASRGHGADPNMSRVAWGVSPRKRTYPK